ncbi:hypothetical protein Adt_14801 [Abeliophyllum distichum]|uniref:Uncharacterized protein n=1 Tax=Abeliophyllum distichum TaxID=126358 RepID=A0ABD1U0R2_9LAMI
MAAFPSKPNNNSLLSFSSGTFSYFSNLTSQFLGAPKARTTFGWGRTTRKLGPSSGSRPLVGWGSAEMELIPKVPDFMAGKSAIRNSLGRIMVSHRGDGWGRSDCSKELI